ncbi:MAG: MMPL family transporter [Actinomycetes bacterium]
MVAWIVVLAGLGVLAGAVGPKFRTTFDLPNVESRQGFDLLSEEFDGMGAGDNGTIVFRSANGFSPQEQAAVTAFLDKVDRLRNTSVQDPFAPGGASQVSVRPGVEGTIAIAPIEVGQLDIKDREQWAEQVRSLAPASAGLETYFGGQMFDKVKAPSSELLGIAFAIVVLLLAFGSVMAMGLPIGVALAGIGVGSTLLVLISNVMKMPDFATQIGIMIGLGVGIDYALFIVTRFREQLHAGHSVEEAVGTAIDTSGRAVTFAGLTVVVSLLGMLLMGVSFVTGLGVGSATIVTITMVASLTLLPALLGFVGDRVERTRWGSLVATGLVALGLFGAGLKLRPLMVALPLAVVVMLATFAFAPLRHEVPRREPRPLRETFAYRWSRVVQNHPWSMALAATLLLLVLAVPVTSLRLGFADQGNDPVGSTTRTAYDLVAQGFGPGVNGPLLLVASLPAGTAPGDLSAVQKDVQAADGVLFVSPPILNDPDRPTAVQWRVIPTTAPQDAATTELVNNLRTEVLPAATQGTGVDVLVTGFVAVTVDFSTFLGERLVLFFAAVLTLSFVLLMVVFRSLLVPFKAVVMNLLSIGAAYGVMVAIFEWGWLKTLFGIEPAPIEPFLPMMLFAIVFGLSMDYEVFLLSRVREEWVRTRDSRTSVADGLAATARVITAAAAIMFFVFGSFLLEDNRSIKIFGFGLALAVLLDATVVRMLLVPATMELLGDKNWWLPGWLDRILPNVNVEGPAELVDEELEAELGELLEEASDPV